MRYIFSQYYFIFHQKVHQLFGTIFLSSSSFPSERLMVIRLMVRISWSRAANVRKDKTYVIRMPFPKTTRIVKAIHQRCLVEDNHRLLGHMLVFAVVCMHGKTIRPLCNSNMHNSDTEYGAIGSESIYSRK